MELFTHAKEVRLKSRHGKYLYADEDELRVTQDRNGSSPNARWTVETVPNAPGVIRLRSRYGRHLSASGDAFLLGMTGRKVIQAPVGRPDASMEWEPVRDGFHVRFKSRAGGRVGGSGSDSKYLRANWDVRPWRNSVTHDLPHLAATQDWVVWDVEVVRVLTPVPPTAATGLDHAVSVIKAPESPPAPTLRPAPSPPAPTLRPAPTPPAPAPAPAPTLRPAPTPQEAHRRPTKSHPTPPPHPEYAPPPVPATKPEAKLSNIESSYSFLAPLHKVEGRANHYHTADDKGDVEDDTERRSFTFNGSNLEELTEKLNELQDETYIDDLIITTLKGLMADREVSSESKRKEKEKQIKIFMEFQTRKLELDKTKVWSKAMEVELKFQAKQKEVEVKLKEVEVKEREIELRAKQMAKELALKRQEVELNILTKEKRIMMADLTDMDSDQRTWFERRRKEIAARDV